MDNDGPHILILYFPPDARLADELARTLSVMVPELRLVLSDGSKRKPISPDDTPFVILLSSPETIEQATSKRIEDLLYMEIADGHVAVVQYNVQWPANWDFISNIVDLTDWKYGAITQSLSQLAETIRQSKAGCAPLTTAIADGSASLRPDGTTRYNPLLFMKVADLELSNRTMLALQADQVFWVGDLVQKTEAEMLRTPNFNQNSLQEISEVLGGLGLSFGLSVAGWPPDEIETEIRRAEAILRAASLEQTRGGAIFEPSGDQLAMELGGDDSDRAAASRSMTQQMQTEVLRKAKVFTGLAHRLDNQPGWDGVSRAGNRLCELLDRPTTAIPDVLGLLYPVSLELGSFLEMDQAILAGQASYVSPLDAELRRPLVDLVRNLAPWLRSFPSAREMDDEAGRFLLRAADLRSTPDVVHAAREVDLISGHINDLLDQLRQVAERGTYQGEKAAGRYKRSASNLVIKSVQVLIGTIFLGAIASDFSTHSPLVQKAGRFLAAAEVSITELIADLPQDLRYAITHIINEGVNATDLLPQAPTNPVKNEKSDHPIVRNSKNPLRRHS